MNAHYFQHVSFEGLGSIESSLQTAGYRITKTRFFESEALPKPDEVAEVSYAFAAKLLADQSRFMEALSQAMAPPKEKK